MLDHRALVSPSLGTFPVLRGYLELELLVDLFGEVSHRLLFSDVRLCVELFTVQLDDLVELVVQVIWRFYHVRPAKWSRRLTKLRNTEAHLPQTQRRASCTPSLRGVSTCELKVILVCLLHSRLKSQNSLILELSHALFDILQQFFHSERIRFKFVLLFLFQIWRRILFNDMKPVLNELLILLHRIQE